MPLEFRLYLSPMSDVASSNAVATSSLSYSDWSRNISSGRLLHIDEILAMHARGETMPVAVRIVGQLESFDASALVTQQRQPGVSDVVGSDDENEEDAEMLDFDDAFPLSPSSATLLGVAILKHRGKSMLIDTSLLLSSYTASSAAATALTSSSSTSAVASSSSRTQFTLDHWYSVIGDLLQFVPHSRSSSSSSSTSSTTTIIYLRARVCRELTEDFDLDLYEQTIKMRREFEAGLKL